MYIHNNQGFWNSACDVTGPQFKLAIWPGKSKGVEGRSTPTVGCFYTFKPCTDVASNLLAIGLLLDVRIACDGLLNILLAILWYFSQLSSYGFHCNSQNSTSFHMIAHMWLCDNYFYKMKIAIAFALFQVMRCNYSIASTTYLHQLRYCLQTPAMSRSQQKVCQGLEAQIFM